MAEENAVAVKLPTFWPHRAKLWFHQAEAQFSVRRITEDDTKYWYVVAALDENSATRVMHLMDNPPAVKKYEAIKAKLLDVFTLSERERMDILLDMKGLAGRTPTEVMDFMLATLGDNKPDPLFKRLFERLLPENIQVILANSTFTDCHELAKAAQKLYKPNDYGEHVVQKMVATTPKKKITTFPEKSSNNDSGYCFYHSTYGAKARQCNPPCNFKTSNVSGNARAGRQ